MARRPRNLQFKSSSGNKLNLPPRPGVSGGWQNSDFWRDVNFDSYEFTDSAVQSEEPVQPAVHQLKANNSVSLRLSYLLVLILAILLFISNAVAWRVVGNSVAWMLLAGAFFSALLLAAAGAWRLFKRGFRKLLAVFLAFTLAPTMYLGANVYAVVYDPTIDGAFDTRMPAKPHLVFYSRDGNKLVTAFDESERFVSSEELWNSHLSKAIIVLEDERLATRYTGPLDPEAIARAIKENLINFEIVEGGSGIEIQTGKLMTGFKTDGFLAKGTQALIAFRLDQRFPTPQEKLCIYANIVVLIGDKRGVGFAAADLFGVSNLKDLTVEQACVIAAMLKNPNIFDPRRNPQKVIERRNIALDNMFKQHLISKTECDKAKAARLYVLPRIKTRELYVRAAVELHALDKIQMIGKVQTK